MNLVGAAPRDWGFHGDGGFWIEGVVWRYLAEPGGADRND